jgi:hypothetical protein
MDHVLAVMGGGALNGGPGSSAAAGRVAAPVAPLFGGFGPASAHEVITRTPCHDSTLVKDCWELRHMTMRSGGRGALGLRALKHEYSAVEAPGSGAFSYAQTEAAAHAGPENCLERSFTRMSVMAELAELRENDDFPPKSAAGRGFPNGLERANAAEAVKPKCAVINQVGGDPSEPRSITSLAVPGQVGPMVWALSCGHPREPGDSPSASQRKGSPQAAAPARPILHCSVWAGPLSWLASACSAWAGCAGTVQARATRGSGPVKTCRPALGCWRRW